MHPDNLHLISEAILLVFLGSAKDHCDHVWGKCVGRLCYRYWNLEASLDHKPVYSWSNRSWTDWNDRSQQIVGNVQLSEMPRSHNSLQYIPMSDSIPIIYSHCAKYFGKKSNKLIIDFRHECIFNSDVRGI